MVMVYEDLGTAVNQALESMNFPLVFLQEHIAVPMDLSPSSVYEYIRNYRLGNIYGSASNNPSNREARLERLAIFLYALGFSEDNKSHAEVISGVRERAAESREQFEYPPPENKRISYEEIKQIYSEQNNNVFKIESVEEENVADRVNRLLKTEVSTEPDHAHAPKYPIIREVYIDGFTRYPMDSVIGATIKVIPQISKTGEALHSHIYRVSYRGSWSGLGEGTRTCKALMEFLSSIEGQKARIIYSRIPHTKRGPIITTVQMIAPVGSEIIYFRDSEILKPYNVKEMRFIGV